MGEMAGQDGDVLATLAQRRDVDGEDGQPVVQVLAEASALDLVLEAPVGGRHDAHVDRMGAVVADRPDLALLEHAQQLGLQARRGLGHLVEEQRAAVGHLEEPLAVAHRAREGAAAVTEQLALEDALRRARRSSPRRRARRDAGSAAWIARATSSLPVPVSPVDQHRAAGGRNAPDERRAPCGSPALSPTISVGIVALSRSRR